MLPSESVDKQKGRNPPPTSPHFWMSGIFLFRKRKCECYAAHSRQQVNVNIILEFVNSEMLHHLTD